MPKIFAFYAIFRLLTELKSVDFRLSFDYLRNLIYVKLGASKYIVANTTQLQNWWKQTNWTFRPTSDSFIQKKIVKYFVISFYVINMITYLVLLNWGKRYM